MLKLGRTLEPPAGYPPVDLLIMDHASRSEIRNRFVLHGAHRHGVWYGLYSTQQPWSTVRYLGAYVLQVGICSFRSLCTPGNTYLLIGINATL